MIKHIAKERSAREGSALQEVTYEIQVLRGGRWQIEASLTDGEVAMADARRLDSTNRCDGVRVLRETFDPDANEFNERILFDTSRRGKRPLREPRRRLGSAINEPTSALTWGDVVKLSIAVVLGGLALIGAMVLLRAFLLR